MKLRVLFIGFNEIPSCNSEEEFERISYKEIDRQHGYFDRRYAEEVQYLFEGNIPTIYDYHLVFLGEPNLKLGGWSSRSIYGTLKSKQQEIMRLIENGGIFVSFLKRYDLQHDVSNYSWQNVINQTDIINKSGNKVIVAESEFQNILNSYELIWDCHLKQNFHISGMRCLAFNSIGDPVAIKILQGKGSLILLPQLKDAKCITKLLRQLTDVIRQKYITGNNSDDVEPTWINQITLADEEKLINEKKAIDEKLGLYKRIKRILYQTGNALVDDLTGVFKMFGLNTRNLDYKGEQDIEIEEGNTKFIVEVKGKDSFANVDDLRQLLDWYVNEESKNESKIPEKQIRGVFIINHYRKMHPDMRKEALSEKALKLAIKNEFVVLTTLDIFDLFKKHSKSPITKDDVLKLFESKIAKEKGKS